jgi:hypothetical protein
MMRRLPIPVTKANLASWVLNFSQRRMRRPERPIQHHEWV